MVRFKILPDSIRRSWLEKDEVESSQQFLFYCPAFAGLKLKHYITFLLDIGDLQVFHVRQNR